MFYRTGCPSRSKTAGVPTIPFRGAGYALYCTVIQIGDGVILFDQLKKTSKEDPKICTVHVCGRD
jgi:hypothetical protein